MPLAALSLLAPSGLLVCLLALLPVAVVALTTRRQRIVAQSLGLEPAPVRGPVTGAALAAATCLALGVAAAQPVLTTTTERSARASSEVVFVTDVSESMAAAAGAGRRTRLDRARSAVAELRAGVPDVPAGISGLTDRVLPYVFPTLDEGVFAEALADSVRVDSPPPQAVSTVATSFAPLASLVRNGFYTPGVEHRACVLLTDGETRSDFGEVGGLASRRGCRLLIVRVGSPSDRIFRADGSAVAAYRPESSAATAVERLARLSGGAAFSEGDLVGAAAALREAAEVGPSRRAGLGTASHPLAPLFAGLALVAASLLLLRAFLRRQTSLHRLRRRRYHAATEVQAGEGS